MPTARSIPRAAARSIPSVTSRLRGFRSVMAHTLPHRAWSRHASLIRYRATVTCSPARSLRLRIHGEGERMTGTTGRLRRFAAICGLGFGRCGSGSRRGDGRRQRQRRPPSATRPRVKGTPCTASAHNCVDLANNGLADRRRQDRPWTGGDQPRRPWQGDPDRHVPGAVEGPGPRERGIRQRADAGRCALRRRRRGVHQGNPNNPSAGWRAPVRRGRQPASPPSKSATRCRSDRRNSSALLLPGRQRASGRSSHTVLDPVQRHRRGRSGPSPAVVGPPEGMGALDVVPEAPRAAQVTDQRPRRSGRLTAAARRRQRRTARPRSRARSGGRHRSGGPIWARNQATTRRAVQVEQVSDIAHGGPDRRGLLPHGQPDALAHPP